MGIQIGDSTNEMMMLMSQLKMDPEVLSLKPPKWALHFLAWMTG